MRDLISRELPWLLETYDGYPHEAQRAAAAAYAVLYLHGGVHASLTMRPVADVSTLLRGHELVLARTPDFGLSNGLLAAPAGHPFLEELLMELPQHARRSWLSVFPEHSRLLASAGSTYLWAKYMHWSQTWPRMPSAVLLPANYGKPSLCDQSNAGSHWPLSSDASASSPSSSSSSSSSSSPLLHLRPPPFEGVSAGSVCLLAAYCHAPHLLTCVLGAVACWCGRGYRRAALLALILALSLQLGAHLGAHLDVGLVEALLVRPWIYLTMGA